MPMTSVMMLLGTGRRKCTSKQNVLKSRSWLWRQNTTLHCFYKTKSSVVTHSMCSGIFSKSVITKFFMILSVKKLQKSVNV